MYTAFCKKLQFIYTFPIFEKVKITIDISDSEKDLVLSFLKENDLSYEFDEEIKIPTWQQNKVLARRREYVQNPESFLSVADLKAQYLKK